jgi:predicted ArsR family transcriptional regulator
MSRLPCESDRKAIELLLGTEVLQVTTIVDGSSCCEYVVRPSEAKLVAAGAKE